MIYAVLIAFFVGMCIGFLAGAFSATHAAMEERAELEARRKRYAAR